MWGLGLVVQFVLFSVDKDGWREWSRMSPANKSKVWEGKRDGYMYKNCCTNSNSPY